MSMSSESQIQMKGIIESSLQRMDDYDDTDGDNDHINDEEDDPEMIFSEDTGEPGAGPSAIDDGGESLFNALAI